MRKFLLSFLMMGLITQISFAQDVIILDHEAAMTTSTFQFFGGAIEGQTSLIIANPNPTGINTSSMVGEFLKVTDSPDWGGGFSDVGVAMDFTSGATEICMKVHMDHVGPILLKLELSSTGGADWEQQQMNTVANEWEEVCWTVDGDAIGNSYDRLTLFFDFGLVVTEDETYYVDDVVVKGAGTATDGNITFSVDMNNYSGTPTQMYVSGAFNGWSGTANPMDDSDGNGVWEATILMPVGAQEYKFSYDDWTGSEALLPTQGCTVTPDGINTNRIITVNGDATLPTVCYTSCFACGEGVRITFNIGTAHMTNLSAEGIFVAGGGNFGTPGDNPLSDPDGDGIFSGTFEKAIGFVSNYTFTNGNCPDWSCKEMIAGQDCADPSNFNDRKMGALMADTIINTCFEVCSDTTVCTVMANTVTFSVDMNNWTEPFTLPYLSGSFNGWSGDANPMEDTDGDGIWTTTLSLVDADYQYKFQLDQWATDEVLVDGTPCTITDGTFVNRLITVAGDAEVCYQFRSCDGCNVVAPDPGMITLEVDMNSYTGTFTTVFLSGAFNGWAGADNPMTDTDGDGIWTTTVMMDGGAQEYKFQVDEWTAQEEFAGGESCTITDPSGQFVNRLITVDGDAAECWNWNVCVSCSVSADDLTIDANLFQVNPTLANEFTRLTFNENVQGAKTILVHNLVGKVIYRAEVDATNLQHDISVSGWTNGLYLVTVQTENLIASKKITKF